MVAAGMVVGGAILSGQVPYQRIVDAAREPGSWLTYNGGYFGHRHSTLDEIWQEVDRTRELNIERRADLKLATTWVINQGVDIATTAYRAAGQHAIFPTNPFEHRLRDALSASQQTQGRPLNFVTIGRVMMGLEPDSMQFL